MHRLFRDLRNRSTPGHKCGPTHCRKDLQGVKRGQAASWEEGGAGGRHKHPHMDAFCATPHCYQSPLTGAATGPFSQFFILFRFQFHWCLFPLFSSVNSFRWLGFTNEPFIDSFESTSSVFRECDDAQSAVTSLQVGPTSPSQYVLHKYWLPGFWFFVAFLWQIEGKLPIRCQHFTWLLPLEQQVLASGRIMACPWDRHRTWFKMNIIINLSVLLSLSSRTPHIPMASYINPLWSLPCCFNLVWAWWCPRHPPWRSLNLLGTDPSFIKM
jgi:hypothetical protein